MVQRTFFQQVRRKLLIAFGIFIAWSFNVHTGHDHANEENGINVLESVDINNHKLWFTARGSSAESEVLLVLHGGPGMCGFVDKYPLLETYFVVVQYDQRGAGKSCSMDLSTANLTISQLRDDALRFSKYLQKRFEKDKVHLLGGSWGSMLGLLMIQKKPNWFYSMSARGQVTNTQDQCEEEGLKFIHKHLPDSKDAIDALAKPPYYNNGQDLISSRSHLLEAGGTLFKCKKGFNNKGSCGKWKLMFQKFQEILWVSEYHFIDKVYSPFCLKASLTKLWKDVIDKSKKMKPVYPVPYFLYHGKYDRVTCAKSAEKWFQDANAPIKKLVWFNESGHEPHKEEPIEFERAFLKKMMTIFEL